MEGLSAPSAGVGVARSLTALVSQASSAIDRNQAHTARNILHAFIRHMVAQKGKHVAIDAADALIAVAQDVIAAL
jgi:hypothetical protein